VAAQVDYPKGHPRRPLADEEIERKFHSLADRKVGREKAKYFIQQIWELENYNEIGAWIAKLPIPMKGGSHAKGWIRSNEPVTGTP
jgi:2-methylcitrate dehydratase